MIQHGFQYRTRWGQVCNRTSHLLILFDHHSKLSRHFSSYQPLSLLFLKILGPIHNTVDLPSFWPMNLKFTFKFIVLATIVVHFKSLGT